MSKKQCDLSRKKYEKKDTSDVKFCCGKCGRKSNKKKKLCNPIK